ncbi:hypothetical protein GF337_11325 [candidate division KSB1 bacterium]|nr:hypothetical protein [candidate division KSB1 bacterium]
MKKQYYYLTILMSIFIFCGQILPENTFAQRRSRARSKFQPGDAIRIEIIEIMETQGQSTNIDVDDDYSIDRDGSITMPLVGEIKVIGHNTETLIELLSQKFSPYFKEPFITVTPLIRLTIMGAFNKPGSYRIDPEESLWELIEMAGGPATGCDLATLRVERSGEVAIENLLSSFERGHSLEEIGVRSGDQIVAEFKDEIGIRDIFDYTRFAITLVLLYLQIENLSNR